MKNIVKSFIGLFLVIALVTACSKDPDKTVTPTPTPIDTTKVDTTTSQVGAPTLTIDSPAFDIEKNNIDLLVVKFRSTPASGSKFVSLKIFRKRVGKTDSVDVYTDSSATFRASATYEKRFENFVENGDTGKYYFAIKITANNGKSITRNTKFFTLKAIKPNLNKTGQFVIGGFANTNPEQQFRFAGINENFATTLEFFKDKSAQTVTPPVPASKADSLTRARFNSSRIDFVFSTSGQTSLFISPDAVPANNDWFSEVSTWSKPLNKTVFVKTTISQSEFGGEDINVEKAIRDLDFTKSPLSSAPNNINGSVVGFLTASGKKGLILTISPQLNKTGFGTYDIRWIK